MNGWNILDLYQSLLIESVKNDSPPDMSCFSRPCALINLTVVADLYFGPQQPPVVLGPSSFNSLQKRNNVQNVLLVIS